MIHRHRTTSLMLILLICVLAVVVSQRLLAGQRPQTEEPPIAPRGKPGVRDVPTPAIPPGARPTPVPLAREPTVSDGTYCPVDPPTPVVSIKVRVPASAAPGEDLQYHLVVENRGKTPAHHVIVRNPLPSNVAFVRADPAPSASDPVLEWRLGTLDGCVRREILLVLKPSEAGEVRNCARVQFEHGECVVTKIGAIPVPPPQGQARLQVRKTGPAQAILHAPIAFRLVVTNAGTAAVQGVELTDTMPDGMEDGATGKSQLTWSVGALGPGESRSYEYQAITKKTGRLCNRAVATAGTLRDEAEACVEVREAKLRIEKTGPKAQYLKLPATYQITVTNDGTTPLTNVVVADSLPDKTSVVRVPEGALVRDKNVEWRLGTLPAGKRRSVQIALQATEAGRVVNQASARADGVAPVSAEFATEFESAAGLTFYAEIADNPVEVKKPTRYTITVVNQGNAAAHDIELTADVPKQMEIKEVRPKDSFKRLGQQITFERLESIDAGATKSFVIEVVPSEAAADARMKVKMTTKELPEGVTREVPVNVVPNGEPPQAR